MTTNILHTADWHLGQLFYGYERTNEHRDFLDFLVKVIQEERIDALLISGDIFDYSNPSAATIKLFYSFLNRAMRVNPDLQIIVIAGNHDSPSRLEAPVPLLESTSIKIIGLVNKTDAGAINFNDFIVPIKAKNGSTIAYCLAVPFLRIGDYPSLPEATNSYTAGVESFYKGVYDVAASLRSNHEPIIAMGHLHTLDAEQTDMDKGERLIMGGQEFIPSSVFNDNIQYVALGHIHKAQTIGGKAHIRYPGSPIPVSFSEHQYKHQVVKFVIEESEVRNITPITIPVTVSLKRVPDSHEPMDSVIQKLREIDDRKRDDDEAYLPFLEVRVLLHQPEPGLKNKIEKALENKRVRLAKIDIKNSGSKENPSNSSLSSLNKLEDVIPEELLIRHFKTKFGGEPSTEMMRLFKEAVRLAHDEMNNTNEN